MANSNGKIGGYIMVAMAAFAAGRCSVAVPEPSQPVATQALLTPANDEAIAPPALQEAPMDNPVPATLLSEPATEEPEARAVYYARCADARADGAAPIHAGEPGYARHLDRDGDGVACE
jgi:hypothetical protein